MDKELEEAIKRALETKQRGMCTISVKTLETVLQTLKKINDETEAQKFLLQQRDIEILDSIPKKVIEKEIEELKNMKVEGEVFKTSVNFAIKVLQELLEGK